MRVIGDLFSETVVINPYLSNQKLVEVRIRNNVKPYQKINPNTNEVYNGFICDEYIFHIPNKENLKEEILNNFNAWVEAGRASEIEEKATLVQEMKEALETLGVQTEIENKEVK